MGDDNLHLADPTDESEETEREVEKSNPEVIDEQGFAGSDTDPDLVSEHDTLDDAQAMGRYTNATEEHPVPLGEASSDDTQG
jgi:hypothetical protein